MKKEIKEKIIKALENYPTVDYHEKASNQILALLEAEKKKSYEEGLQEGIKDGYKNFQEWKKKEKERWAEEIQKLKKKYLPEDFRPIIPLGDFKDIEEYTRAYNQALNDVLNIFNSLK